jgi:hypothetical protein
MTLLYNGSVTKNKNSPNSQRENQSQMIPKDQFKILTQKINYGIRQSMEAKRKTVSRKTDIKNFYMREIERNPQLRSGFSTSRNTMMSRKTNSEVINTNSRVSLRVLEERELKETPQFTRSIVSSKPESSDFIISKIRRTVPKKVNLEFSDNPIYAKFKNDISPVNKNLRSFRASMVHVMNDLENINEKKIDFAHTIIPKLNRLSKIQTNSLQLLHKRLNRNSIESIVN